VVAVVDVPRLQNPFMSVGVMLENTVAVYFLVAFIFPKTFLSDHHCFI
jgi:hypothetical protein